jgi:hypothetical protein
MANIYILQEEAASKINIILEQLEKDTNCIVENVNLNKINVSSLDSECCCHLVGINIELRGAPEHRWQK